MEDKIFDEEQRHLTEVYGKLSAMKDKIDATLDELYEKAADAKKNIRDDLTLNFDSDTDTMETYIEFETVNRVIDSYNVESNTLNEKLHRVKQLLAQPYFARITLQFDEEEEPEDFYIGSTAMSENGYDNLVTDWRAPIAEAYYNQENGRTSYEVEGRRIPVDLLLRRQFDITKDELHAYFDTQIAIEDPLLLQSLSKRRSDKMTDITATIQKEQNAVIRYADVPVLVVNGIAGSGKTSVLLQRIAYLFYRQRKNLNPKDVYLITLNPVFSRYIENVLPNLGERNPITETWGELMKELGAPDAANEDHTDPGALRKIDDALPDLKLQPDDYLPISQGSAVILSAGAIQQVVDQYAHIKTGPRLVQVVTEALLDKARANARKRREDGRDSEDAGDDPGTEDPKKEDNVIENQFGGAFQAIRRYGWLSVGHVGRRILGKKDLSAAEWLYLKMALTGLCERSARYVCIDEVQDYTEAQLLVMRRYFPRAKFLLLGDESQAVRPGTVSFRDIHALFEENGQPVTELPLMTSYRSSPEITEIFRGLMPESRGMEARSVQRPGDAPQLVSCGSGADYEGKLRAAVQAAEKRDGTTAIVCADEDSLVRIAAILGDEAPVIVESGNALPEQGVCLITLRMAKGLEFDGVIIPDADELHYPSGGKKADHGAQEYPAACVENAWKTEITQNDRLARNRLYTAVSRATRFLTILSEGDLTGLLG